jgi:type IV pilus assembly protein PilP
MSFRYLLTAVLSLPLLTLIAGCGGNEQAIRAWMKEIEQQTQVQISPINAPKKFIPFGYVSKAETDPFNPSKLLVAIAKLRDSTKLGIKIDETRVREAAEGWPLDSFKMVGILEKSGLQVALVQVDKTIYQVKVGGYMGQNHGRITSITETEVNLIEIVQDAVGDNVEHEAKLELQENKK